MGEGLLAMDREGYCIYANAAAGKILGYPPRTLLGQILHEVVHPSASSVRCDSSHCPILLSLQSTSSRQVDDPGAVFIRNNRDALPVSYVTSPIIEKDLIQGVVVTFIDATARRAEDERWRRIVEEKEREIQRLKNGLEAAAKGQLSSNPSDDVLDKIRKLLG
jgi:PAS domain S-box-containing protein